MNQKIFNLESRHTEEWDCEHCYHRNQMNKQRRQNSWVDRRKKDCLKNIIAVDILAKKHGLRGKGKESIFKEIISYFDEYDLKLPYYEKKKMFYVRGPWNI